MAVGDGVKKNIKSKWIQCSSSQHPRYNQLVLEHGKYSDIFLENNPKFLHGWAFLANSHHMCVAFLDFVLTQSTDVNVLMCLI